MYIIVGNEPETKNSSKGFPLMGTPSWPTLKEWLDFWGVKSYMLLNSSNGYWYQKIKEQGTVPKNTFICLGNKAWAQVKRAKVKGTIIRTPTPSPDNTTLKNKAYVETMLTRVKQQIK